jgi:hypothetical protein
MVAAFDELPSDVLLAVCQALAAADLARLCIAHHAAFQLCDNAFCAERAAAAGLQTSSLAVLALNELLLERLTQMGSTTTQAGSTTTQAGSNTAQVVTTQVGFEYGGKTLDDDEGTESGVRHSRGRIAAVAEALRTFPLATAVIDAHVGLGAPSGIATEYSIARGAMIAAVLVWNHQIDVARLRVRGWGKRVTRLAHGSPHPNGAAARAGFGWGELFVTHEAVELPARPDYYGGSDQYGDSEYYGAASGQRVVAASELEGAELATQVSRAGAALRAAERRGSSLTASRRYGLAAPAPLPPPSWFGGAVVVPLPGDSSEEESGDEDESESSSEGSEAGEESEGEAGEESEENEGSAEGGEGESGESESGEDGDGDDEGDGSGESEEDDSRGMEVINTLDVS